MRKLRSRLTYANVTATLALVIAVAGGTAYAANTVFSTDIVDGEVKAADLANNAVRTAKIADGQVTAPDLAPPEPWLSVRAGSTASDQCATRVATFCSVPYLGGDLWPWRNYGSGFATAGFYEDQLGVVHLKGLIANDLGIAYYDQTSNPIFKLPAAYRPDRIRVFGTGGDGGSGWEVGPARIDVRPDGLVVFVADCDTSPDVCSSTAAYVTLDGISFRPDE